MTRDRARVLLIGLGGLGCPAAIALARAGVGEIGLCDDDVVELTNLHRQILFSQADVGTLKLDAAARVLKEINPRLLVRSHRTRLVPENAVRIASEYDVVLEGSDNFATKFLTADACALAGRPVVHASAVRWVGTALAVGSEGQPCYRCLFEDIPVDGAPNCADAGVMGPVLGIVAAAQVDFALAMIDGAKAAGHMVTFDGRSGVFRRRPVPPRPDCPLCSSVPRIRRIEEAAYVSPACVG